MFSANWQVKIPRSVPQTFWGAVLTISVSKTLHLVLLWLLRGLFNGGEAPLEDIGDRIGMGSKLDSMGSGECGGELDGAGRVFERFVGGGQVVAFRQV